VGNACGFEDKERQCIMTVYLINDPVSVFQLDAPHLPKQPLLVATKQTLDALDTVLKKIQSSYDDVEISILVERFTTPEWIAQIREEIASVEFLYVFPSSSFSEIPLVLSFRASGGQKVKIADSLNRVRLIESMTTPIPPLTLPGGDVSTITTRGDHHYSAKKTRLRTEKQTKHQVDYLGSTALKRQVQNGMLLITAGLGAAVAGGYDRVTRGFTYSHHYYYNTDINNTNNTTTNTNLNLNIKDNNDNNGGVINNRNMLSPKEILVSPSTLLLAIATTALSLTTLHYLNRHNRFQDLAIILGVGTGIFAGVVVWGLDGMGILLGVVPWCVILALLLAIVLPGCFHPTNVVMEGTTGYDEEGVVCGHGDEKGELLLVC